MKYKIIEHKDAPLADHKTIIDADAPEVSADGSVRFTKQNLNKTPGVTGQPDRSLVAFYPKVGGFYELSGKELAEANKKEADENKPEPAEDTDL